MFDIQAQLGRLLRRSEDPLGLISPDQLKLVLKSIEGKYNALRDENKRLKDRISELEARPPRPEADPEREALLEARLREADEAHNRLTALREEFERLQQDHRDALDRLAQVDEQQARPQEVELRLSALDQEKAALRAQLEEALSEIDRLREAPSTDTELRLTALERELDSVRSQYEEAIAERDLLRIELEKAKESAKDADIRLEDRLAALDPEKVALRTQLQEVLAECDRLKSALEAKPRVQASPSEAPRPTAEEDRRRLLSRLISGG